MQNSNVDSSTFTNPAIVLHTKKYYSKSKDGKYVSYILSSSSHWDDSLPLSNPNSIAWNSFNLYLSSLLKSDPNLQIFIIASPAKHSGMFKIAIINPPGRLSPTNLRKIIAIYLDENGTSDWHAYQTSIPVIEKKTGISLILKLPESMNSQPQSNSNLSGSQPLSQSSKNSEPQFISNPNLHAKKLKHLDSYSPQNIQVLRFTPKKP